jgi:hypothetical protein
VIQNLEQRVARIEMTAAPYISPRSVAHVKGAIFLIKGNAKPARLTSVTLEAHGSAMGVLLSFWHLVYSFHSASQPVFFLLHQVSFQTGQDGGLRWLWVFLQVL